MRVGSSGVNGGGSKIALPWLILVFTAISFCIILFSVGHLHNEESSGRKSSFGSPIANNKYPKQATTSSLLKESTQERDAARKATATATAPPVVTAPPLVTAEPTLAPVFIASPPPLLESPVTLSALSASSTNTSTTSSTTPAEPVAAVAEAEAEAEEISDSSTEESSHNRYSYTLPPEVRVIEIDRNDSVTPFQALRNAQIHHISSFDPKLHSTSYAVYRNEDEKEEDSSTSNTAKKTVDVDVLSTFHTAIKTGRIHARQLPIVSEVVLSVRSLVVEMDRTPPKLFIEYSAAGEGDGLSQSQEVRII